MRSKFSKGFLHIFLGMILGFLSITPCVYADNDITSADSTNHFTQANSWSFQFAISYRFWLTNFNGTMLSVKKQTSKRSALRLAFSIYTNQKSEEFDASGNAIKIDDRDKNDFSLNIKCQYLIYYNPQSPVKFYFGLGPDLGFHYHEELRIDPESQEFLSSSDYRHAWILGLIANWGVEWFFTKSASLFAEYGATIEYTNYINQSIDWGYTNYWYQENQISLYALPVRFGISVYF